MFSVLAPRTRTGVAVAALAAALVVAAPSLRGQSSQAGEWSPVFDMPLVAVHAALMPTGQLLFFDAWEIPGTPSARLWDPDSGEYTPTPNGFAELFCAGHILTHDGRLLTAGGHNGAGVGTGDVTVFDAATRQWTALPSIVYPRWYPSLVQLADGRALTIGGAISRPDTAWIPEAFTLGASSWTEFPIAQKDVGEYPVMFQGPGGRVFVSEYETSMSWWLDPSASTPALAWTPLGRSPAASGPGVMYRPGQVLMAGGGTLNADPVVTSAGVIDLNQPTPSWRQVGSMQYGRSQHNLVILPDGKVLVVGGANEVSLISTNGVLPAEIWDPATEQWTTVAAMTRPRMYHSIALLLPDGRVLAAGGGRINPAVPDETNGEFYSPPYLFKGARPIATAAPATVGYGQSFAVQTPDPGAIARVTFVRVSSVTHGLNLDQRFFELPFTSAGGAVVAEAPADARLAPAGDYFVFLLNGQGVPSIGRRVRLGGAGGTATLDVSDASVNEGTGTANTLVFSVTRTGDDSQTVTVQYATGPGTAEAGSDYVAASGSLTFPPNTASRTVSVTTVADGDVEPNETLTVTLSAPVNAAIGDGTAVGTIVNDDEPPPPTLAIGNAAVVEGSGGAPPVARFTVVLSEASAQDVLVNFRTLAGTATAGSDYTTTNGVLTFAGGTVVQTVQVPVHPDTEVEPLERFSVELFSPTHAVLQTPIGVGSIFDDDNGIATAIVPVAAGPDDVNEAAGPLAPPGASVWLGRDGSAEPSLLGLRFASVPLPPGATILEARLEVTPTASQSGPLAFEYAAVAGVPAAPFTAGAPPSARALLALRQLHTSNQAWTAGARRALDDIAPLVQAAIAQPFWAAGQSLALVLRATGDGRRDIAAAEAGAATAPRLVITFMIGSAIPNAPRVLTSQVSADDVAFAWQAPPPAGRPVTGYVLEAGLAPGHTLVTLPLGDVRETSVRAPEGVFFVRVRAVTLAGTGPPSNEVRVATGTLAAPLAPTAVLATVQGTRLTFQWSHGPLGNVATGFQLQAGTEAGAVDIGVLPVVGTARSVSIDAPPGTYHVRVVALNPAGASPPSPSVVVSPRPGACTPPHAPAGLVAGGSPGAIAVSWAAPQSGAIPTGYLLRVGSVSGGADIGVLTLGPQLSIGGAVPPGPYFLRVAATNACGMSAPSAEVSAVVP